MITKVKIALSVPARPGRYFSFRLKQELSNEPGEYQMPDKIFVLSDIEGNFQSFRKLLQKNGVIDGYLRWIFKDGHLVILGDCFDRGEYVIECLWLIYSLEEQAKKEGGYVHFILGNHEIMNLNGDWRYMHPKYAEKKRTSRTPAAALYEGNRELWRWLRTKNIIEKIGDVLFVHGGVAKQVNELDLSVSDINNLVRPHYSTLHQVSDILPGDNVFSGEESPFWYRGYYQGTASEEQVDNTLRRFRVATIITGHTIVDEVMMLFGGKVINVNTDHAMGRSQALLIKKGRFYKVDIEGARSLLK